MHSLVYKTTACIAFLLCLSWYGQTHFYRDPGSVFFDKARAYETGYSAIRRAEAEQMIGSLTSGAEYSKAGASGNRTICIALNSVARKIQYLPVRMLHPLTLLPTNVRLPDNDRKHPPQPFEARARRPRNICSHRRNRPNTASELERTMAPTGSRHRIYI